MQPLPFKELDSPTAKELAELILMQNDIEFSIAAMKIWCAKNSAGTELSREDQIICTALFRDSVVQFTGCFYPKATYPLSKERIYNAEHEAYFRWLLDLRDAYAAHRFGALRQGGVGLLLDDNNDVVGSGPFIACYLGPIPPGGPQFIEFMEIARDFVNKRIGELNSALLAEGQALSIEQRRSLKSLRMYGVDSGEIRQSRQEMQRTKGAR